MTNVEVTPPGSWPNYTGFYTQSLLAIAPANELCSIAGTTNKDLFSMKTTIIHSGTVSYIINYEPDFIHEVYYAMAPANEFCSIAGTTNKDLF